MVCVCVYYVQVYMCVCTCVCVCRACSWTYHCQVTVQLCALQSHCTEYEALSSQPSSFIETVHVAPSLSLCIKKWRLRLFPTFWRHTTNQCCSVLCNKCVSRLRVFMLAHVHLIVPECTNYQTLQVISFPDCSFFLPSPIAVSPGLEDASNLSWVKAKAKKKKKSHITCRAGLARGEA